LTLVRDGKRQQKTVKLRERPTGEEEAAVDEGGERKGGTQWLGLEYQELTSTLRKGHSIPDDVDGIFVNDVAPSSPLYEEGFREGDIVTEVSGTPVKSAADFEAVAKAAKSGSYLRLYVRRFDPRSPRDLAFFAIVRVP